MLASLFLLISMFSLDSDSTDYEDIYDNPYLIKADSFKNLREYDNAIEIAQKAKNEFRKNDNINGEIATNILIGSMYNSLRQLDSAGVYLSNSLFLHSLKEDNLLADIYYELGNMYRYNKEPDSSLFYHQSALIIRKKIFGEKNQEVASSYNAIANVYRYVFLDFYNAEKYYIKALNINEQLRDVNNLNDIAQNCYNLATTNRLKGDLEKSLTYAYSSLNILKESNSSDTYRIALSYSAIANIMFQLEMYKKSIPHFLMAIEYLRYDRSRYRYLPILYTNISGSYIQLNNKDSANYYLGKALELTRDQNPVDSASLAFIYQQIGAANFNNTPDSSEFYYKRGLRIMESKYGQDSINIASFYIDLGRLNKKEKKYTIALSFIEKALNFLSYKKMFLLSSSTNNTDFSSTPSILLALRVKAESYYSLYQDTKDPDYLVKALDEYLSIDNLLMQHRNILDRESAQQTFAENYKPSYEIAIYCSFNLYQKTKEDSLIELAYNLMEKNKANILLSHLIKTDKMEGIGIPDSLINTQQSLLSQLAFYNSELLTQDNEEQVTFLQKKIFTTERKLNKLNDHILNSFPQYYSDKYNTNIYTFHEIREILQSKNTSMIEYFWGDSALFILAYNHVNDSSYFHKVKNIEALSLTTDSLISVINKGFNIQSVRNDYQNFTTLSHQVYKKLVQPIFNEINFSEEEQNLIIIPDGKLAILPFETLIEDEPASNNVDYKSLAYLVKKFTINYSFSGQLVLENSSNSLQRILDKAVVFSYESNVDKSITSSISGTYDEANHIVKLLPATLYAGEEATEENFRKYAENASIIHLAVHGNTNEENPMKSGLRFRSSSENEQYDNLLYYYELMNLNLQASLAVLSACETGLGKYFKGEGVYHIARAFQYAGCPSIVSSLWRIDDQKTTKIMYVFYQELSKEQNIAQALRTSKINYLNNSDETLAHPKFWSGLIILGNSEKFTISNSPSYHLLLFSILGILITIIFITYFIKK
ncbi:CHAT domain-containing tetratricopeptide repeat protein [Catalinimonas sp. 4WD22]|uniref:CHAT domain-containing protein n=1 Tax=Catalinimonas locisalis TaxID=3133978 RepID=UPI00310164B2